MLSACSPCVSGIAWSGHMMPHDCLYVLLSYNSAAATLTSPGLICLGETAIFRCTIMDSLLSLQYENSGFIFRETDSTLGASTFPVDDVTLTFTRISNGDGILVLSLSFIATMGTNGDMITCSGGVLNEESSREDAIVQFGSGKNSQHYTCTQLNTNVSFPQTPLQRCLWWVWSV